MKEDQKAIWYVRCCTCLTLNVALIIISFTLWYGDVSEYGEVIKIETAEWADGPITDFLSIQADQICPESYDRVSGTFWGTKTWCDGTFYDSLGKCGQKSTSWTVLGVSETSISTIQSQGLCIKRDSRLNYHSMATDRGLTCTFGQHCGSLTDEGKSYCLADKSLQCPINDIQINQSDQKLDGYSTMKMPQGGYFAQVTTQANSNAYVSMRMALNPPCGDRNQVYVKRNFPVGDIYEQPKKCYYSELGTGKLEHPLYQKLAFSDTEYNVYQQNGLLSKIIDKTKGYRYDEAELKKNFYSVYVKPYSHWGCQGAYSTEFVAAEGLKAGSTSSGQLYILIATMTLCILLGLDQIYNFFDNYGNTKLIIVWTVLEFVAYVVLALIYLRVGSQFSGLDSGLLEYARDNACSDGALNTAFTRYADSIDGDSSKATIGLLATLASLAIFISTFTCARMHQNLHKKYLSRGSDDESYLAIN